MKKLTKLLCLIISAMLLLSVLPLQGFAAGEIDTAAQCSLTISFTHEQHGVSGVEYEIYRVASVSADAQFTVEQAFAGYPVDFTDLDDDRLAELASTLQGYVLSDALVPAASGKTDADGKLMFSDLQPGLYLVLGNRLEADGKIYKPVPFMICLPFEDKESVEWNYDPTVIPKFSVEDVPPSPETVKIKVLKIWDDKGSEKVRPTKITVQLLCDGKPYSSVTLSKENNWSYSWENLDKNHDWTVVETKLDNYTVKVKRQGNTFTLTNTYTKPPEKPTEPSDEPIIKTGLLWWPVPVLLGAGVLCIIVAMIRSKQSDK